MTIKCWGIKSKNSGQEQALSALMDPSIDLVIMSGIAGSGKTLLALAAGLEQVIEQRMYKEIIFTRAPIGVGENLGFLPGEITEKMLPWAGALIDNLEELNLDETVAENKIKILAMQHMRGRSFNKKYVIIDEVQNITPEQIKVLITRAGEDTKIICLGDPSQIDNKKLGKSINGLSYLESKAFGCPFVRHIVLPNCERSRLAKWAGNVL